MSPDPLALVCYVQKASAMPPQAICFLPDYLKFGGYGRARAQTIMQYTGN